MTKVTGTKGAGSRAGVEIGGEGSKRRCCGRGAMRRRKREAVEQRTEEAENGGRRLGGEIGRRKEGKRKQKRGKA